MLVNVIDPAQWLADEAKRKRRHRIAMLLMLAIAVGAFAWIANIVSGLL